MSKIKKLSHVAVNAYVIPLHIVNKKMLFLQKKANLRIFYVSKYSFNEAGDTKTNKNSWQTLLLLQYVYQRFV